MAQDGLGNWRLFGLSNAEIYSFVENRWVKGIALIPTYVVGLSIANHFGGIAWVVGFIATLVVSDWMQRRTFNCRKIGSSALIFWKRFSVIFFAQLIIYLMIFFLVARVAG